jgi:hypothetical protein
MLPLRHQFNFSATRCHSVVFILVLYIQEGFLVYRSLWGTGTGAALMFSRNRASIPPPKELRPTPH